MKRESTGAPSLVFYLSSEWSRYHRPGLIRALARALDRQAPVLVVDNPVCRLTSRWHRPERWRRWHSGAGHLSSIGTNLSLLDAAIPLHDRLACRLPGAGALNRSQLAPQVKNALRCLGQRGPLVTWFQFPTFHHYVGMLDETLPVYECYDEHSDVPGLPEASRQRLIRLESRLMAACDLVFTTSRPLYESRSARHANVVLSYNAAEPSLFAPVAADSLERARQRAAVGVGWGERSDAQHNSAPALTVGYLGTIHEHTDLALLAGMAQRRPDWRFVLIGPVQAGADAASLAALRAAPNVAMHGWVEEADLAGLLSSVDVGVIPYRNDSRFNRYVNPNKLHEFTAMGKPVVLAPSVDASSHAGRVSIAEGLDAFIAAVEAEHAQNSVARVEERLAFAQANSWDARAAVMLEHISRTLAQREPAR